jgi:catechol 2,3-dioxygenase-like lactoylglutathione lyase family enzyme
MELNTVRVFVRDIEAARQFYEQRLGLRLKADGSDHGYCVFKTGRTELVVERVAENAPDEDKAQSEPFAGKDGAEA